MSGMSVAFLLTFYTILYSLTLPRGPDPTAPQIDADSVLRISSHSHGFKMFQVLFAPDSLQVCCNLLVCHIRIRKNMLSQLSLGPWSPRCLYTWIETLKQIGLFPLKWLVCRADSSLV